MNNMKNILRDVINTLGESEILGIHYQGFVGRGINGLANNIAYLNKDIERPAEKWQNFYSTKMEKYCLDYVLLEECIMIKYQDVSLGHGAVHKEYTLYIPYSSMTSFEVIHKI